MALRGSRVVRGPDWKWDDQDGVEGGVGTIIDVDGPSKVVTVLWDNGNQAQYRAGHKGFFDLRILDSSPAGVLFTSLACNGCLSAIAGMQWHCNECHDFDLCATCYFNDVHSTNHTFTRFEDPNDRNNGVQVGKRSEAAGKLQSKGLFTGAIVRISKDWIEPNDGQNWKHIKGTVLGVSPWNDTPRSAVRVEWDTLLDNNIKLHRAGHKGKVDLKCTVLGKGYHYYEEHLPCVSVDVGGRLKDGDRVTIHLDVEIVRMMEKGHGEWKPEMKETIGKVGRVIKTDENGDVVVKYESLNNAEYTFHPAALYKVPNLKEGNKVSILKNREIVMKLQNGLWEDNMKEVLGMKGEVIYTKEEGDSIVSVNGHMWRFNPAVLILECSENDEATEKEQVLDIFLQIMEGIISVSIGDDLVIAAYEGNMEKAKRIIESDRTKVNHQLSNGKCALHMACLHGKADMARYLLENGANKNLKDKDGDTPLHNATFGYDNEALCTHVLLEMRADANSRDTSHATPLHLAVKRGNEAAVGALVQYEHCDVNHQDQSGNTPLHSALMHSKDSIFSEIIESCEMNAIDPTLCNKEGLNILHLACSKNNTQAVKMLVNKYPGLLDLANTDGWFPLHLAVLNNQYENAKTIIQLEKCDINLKHFKKKATALFLAVSLGYRSIIELLIENKADVNAQDAFGNTPLHVAVRKHCMCTFEGAMEDKYSIEDANIKCLDFAIALFLVLRGANITYRNCENKTPLDICTDLKLAQDLKLYSAKCSPDSRSKLSTTPNETIAKRSGQSNPDYGFIPKSIDIQTGASSEIPKQPSKAMNRPPVGPSPTYQQRPSKQKTIPESFPSLPPPLRPIPFNTSNPPPGRPKHSSPPISLKDPLPKDRQPNLQGPSKASVPLSQIPENHFSATPLVSLRDPQQNKRSKAASAFSPPPPPIISTAPCPPLSTFSEVSNTSRQTKPYNDPLSPTLIRDKASSPLPSTTVAKNPAKGKRRPLSFTGLKSCVELDEKSKKDRQDLTAKQSQPLSKNPSLKYPYLPSQIRPEATLSPPRAPPTASNDSFSPAKLSSDPMSSTLIREKSSPSSSSPKQPSEATLSPPQHTTPNNSSPAKSSNDPLSSTLIREKSSPSSSLPKKSSTPPPVAKKPAKKTKNRPLSCIELGIDRPTITKNTQPLGATGSSYKNEEKTKDAERKEDSDGDGLKRQSVSSIVNKFEAFSQVGAPSVENKVVLEKRCTCDENVADVVFEPCKHKVACSECALKMKRCSKCNTKINNKRTTDGSLLSAALPKNDYNERVKELEMQLQQMEYKTECPICMEKDSDVVFDCGHRSCQQCSNIEVCPQCSKRITDKRVMYY